MYCNTKLKLTDCTLNQLRADNQVSQTLYGSGQQGQQEETLVRSGKADNVGSTQESQMGSSSHLGVDQVMLDIYIARGELYITNAIRQRVCQFFLTLVLVRMTTMNMMMMFCDPSQSSFHHAYYRKCASNNGLLERKAIAIHKI